MTNKRTLYGLCLAQAVFIATLACARSSACDPATGACLPAAESVVRLNEDVVLTPGKVVRLEDSQVRLSFERVVSDSRCPRDVTCVWAGNAATRIRFWIDGDTARVLELNTTVEPKVGQLDGYVVRVVGLAPDPVSTRRIEPADYRLTIQIGRQ